MKNKQTANCMKISSVRAELLHADRNTDGRADRHDEPNSRFSPFCEHALKSRKYTVLPFTYQSRVLSDTYLLSRLATTDLSLWTVG